MCSVKVICSVRKREAQNKWCLLLEEQLYMIEKSMSYKHPRLKNPTSPVDASAGLKSAVQSSAVYTLFFTSYRNKKVTNQI